MQITFRAETEVHDECHRVPEREICEFFVVFKSANQPVDHTTSNESRLHRTPAQEVRGLCEKGKGAFEAEVLQCGEDVLASKRIDRIDARHVRRRAHSGCPR